MSGVEVLAGLGLLATELFKYNRENYEFDQDQRFEREECRLKMQIERFTLFREDIRDLVELTVGKMDLYHLIGALFLKMIVLYYCVGFFTKPVPPFVLILYYVSLAACWVWLMIAIWFAMHASISSHSYGTRLLTRFVRLPIPGSAQLNVLNARYADFEKQGLQMWRVPFLGRQANTWRQRNAEGSLGDDAPKRVVSDKEPERRSRRSQRGGKAASSSKGASGTTNMTGGAAAGASDWLGSGEYAYGGESDMAGREAEMLRAVEFRTHRHVQLFRSLQSQWQCFDAYARVAMSLGVRAMIQSLCYYLMGICMVDQQAPFVAYVLIVFLQATAMSIYVMDIHGLPCYGNLDLSLLGAAPCILALIELSIGNRNEEGLLLDDNRYRVSCACFPLEVCWMHLSIWAASPTDREQALPRHFRSVLFMDVFAEVDDPMDSDPKTGQRKLNIEDETLLEQRAEAADVALYEANCALRRWEAVPHDALSHDQRKQLKHTAKDQANWIHALSHELQMRKVAGIAHNQKHRRSWVQLSTGEREEDPFTGYLLGPFTHGGDSSGAGGMTYYYDPESNEYLEEPLPDGVRVFTVQQCTEVVRHFAEEVERVVSLAGRPGARSADHGGRDDGDDDDSEGDSPLTYARSQSTITTSKTKAVPNAEDQLRPNRLPWHLTRIVGRAIQAVWIFCFIMMVLRATDYFVVDWQGIPVRDSLARRLAHEMPREQPRDLLIELVAGADDDAWPGGTFFRATGLSCLPNSTLAPGLATELLATSPYAAYRIVSAGSGAATARRGLEMEELPWGEFPPGAVAVCGGAAVSSGPRCLIAEAGGGKIAFWPRGGRPDGKEAFALAFEGEPWDTFAGALVPCGGGERGGERDASAGDAECLLLAGAPRRGGAIAAALLPRPRPGARGPLVADFELPLAGGSAGSTGGGDGPRASPMVGPSAPALTALHVGDRGTLLVMTSAGELGAWELLGGPPRRLGAWRPRWPGSARGAGLCEDPSGDVFVLGHVAAGRARGPALWRARLRAALQAAVAEEAAAGAVL